MFLPLKTEAHDGKFRMGAIGIVLACIIVHILVWRDEAGRAEKVSTLDQQISKYKSDKHVQDLIGDAGGDGVLDDGSPARARDSAAAGAVQSAEKERKASLFYRLALVKGDFNPVNLITSMFAHSGFLHLFFNMWFFYLVGVTMEKYWGTEKFLGLYLACGVIAALGYLAVSQGVKSLGVPMVGASGAIAGMMGAFAVTHGEAKVTIMWFLGFRGGTFQVSTRIYLAFWIAGQLLDGLLDSGKAGGTAYSAHIAGFLAGLAIGKWVPGDVFYRKAYVPDAFGEAVDKLASRDKLDVPAPIQGPAAPLHQNGGETITLLNQGRHALEQGNGRDAGGLLFQAMEKAFAIPGLDPKILETALTRLLESLPGAVLPAGALYAWARRLENIDWWQWSIHYYDAATNDASGATNDHARHGARFRAAVLRMDHLYQKEQAAAAFQAIVASDENGSYYEEAGQRLAALRTASSFK